MTGRRRRRVGEGEPLAEEEVPPVVEEPEAEAPGEDLEAPAGATVPTEHDPISGRPTDEVAVDNAVAAAHWDRRLWRSR